MAIAVTGKEYLSGENPSKPTSSDELHAGDNLSIFTWQNIHDLYGFEHKTIPMAFFHKSNIDTIWSVT